MAVKDSLLLKRKLVLLGCGASLFAAALLLSAFTAAKISDRMVPLVRFAVATKVDGRLFMLSEGNETKNETKGEEEVPDFESQGLEAYDHIECGEGR